MATQKRWMKSMIAEAAKEQVSLPWARGARRAEWKDKRTEQPGEKRNSKSAQA